MYSRLKIGSKIILLVLILVIITVIGESIISYYRYKEIVERTYLDKLELIEGIKINNLNAYFKNFESQLDSIADEPIFHQNHNYYFNRLDTASNSMATKEYFQSELSLNKFVDLKQIDDFYILNNHNTILYQHSNMDVSGVYFHNLDNETIDIHKDHFHINEPVINDKKEFYTYITTPIYELPHKEGEIIGFFVIKIETTTIFDRLKLNNKDISGEYEVLVYRNHQDVIYSVLSNPNNIRRMPITEKSHPIYISARESANKNFGEGIYSEQDGEKQKDYFAIWEHFPHLGVGMMIRVPCDAHYNNTLNEFNFYSLLIGILIIIISILLSFGFARIITYPMLKLKKVLSLVSNGILPKELHTPLQDEVGDMIKIVNKIVNSLKNTAAFAIKIGEGEFDSNFKPLSTKDTLGQALVNMRESLKNADEKDLLRNWIVTGVAEIGEILRNNNSLESLGDQILIYVCNRIKAVQGAFYVVNEDDPANPNLEMKASYAYKKKKFLKKTYRYAEGLVGQSAIEQSIILRTEIPDDYLDISSGLLGDQKPKCLLIIPLITEEKVYGIIELAGFARFDEGKIEFMKEVSEIISRTVSNIRVNEHTKKLLEESQRMSSELRVQQSELQNNAREMEQTQSQLQESNQQLELQITEVNNAQKRIQALLENASEVITIYEKDGTIKYVSPSVEHILGYKQEELVGISDKKYISQQHQETFQKMFSRLLGDDGENVTIQMSYFRKKGDKIWLEATGKNMLKDPAIQGIVVNSHDITERRRAAEEERKRGQMQALSENSPDLITRLGKSGRIFYINPSIKRFTGNNPKNYINKTIPETDIPEVTGQKWQEIIDAVIADKEKKSTEIYFPTESGKRIMSISAIPEFNMDTEIETVLVVSHDVTEQKAIEHEIKQTNIKINDSINYAEHIQEAILPDTQMIQETFKESFIYFRPRDVVSGDFPWFMKHDNKAYIAAVDCTGHGVPGAMISVVGYFLLNNIVDGKGELSAGAIIDRLDQLVTSTFKQDQSTSKIKDGMDISFCKIDLETGEMEYAGANRPLYLMSGNGILSEIKGDKYPIGGGGAYGQKAPFKNNIITLNKGDSIYMFSDGYPDQFGGSNHTKFGTRRMRELLERTKHQQLEEIHKSFDDEFEIWRGHENQTDDVILIGIRF